MKPNLIIEPFYLPDIFFISQYFIYKNVILNDEDIFLKQTSRNRTFILHANGVLPLIIPLKKGKSHIPFKDVEIDHKLNWARIHWQSIISAYNKSPYFLHYRDYFEKHFKLKTRFLVDFNVQLLSEILKILELDNRISLLSSPDNKVIDLSDHLTDKIFTKKKDKLPMSGYEYKPYPQVFSDRFDFIPGLSVIDLIFNTGPEAMEILTDGIRK